MRKPGRGMLRPGALFVITVCFLGSGLLRFAEYGPAIAEEISAMSAVAETPETAPEPQAPPMQCPPQLEPQTLLVAIQTRQSQLALQEAQLNDREQVLRVSALKIKEQMSELEEAEQRLADTLAFADNAAEKDIQRLTSVYENMKAKNAATIFESMDVNFAAGFLMRMRPDAAADVMSNLKSDTAYSISVVMAGRNVGVPVE